MRKRFFLFALLPVYTCTMFATSTLDSLLSVYDAEVSNSATYIRQHQQYIDSLRAIRPLSPDMEIRIAREYQYFQSDTACAWYQRLTTAEEPYRSKAYLGLIQLYSSMGKPSDGIALIQQVDSVPDSLRVDWIEAIWKLYKEASVWTTLPALKEEWTQSAQIYYDSLLVEMQKFSDESEGIRLRLEILKAINAGDMKAALCINDTMLQRVPEWSHPYAILAYDRAILYETAGQDRKRIEWLTRSSIADVRCGITDNGSSWLVAKECYESGDLEKAHHFSDYSLTNASIFNAPTRFIQTYTLGHEIGSSYENKLHTYSVQMLIAMLAFAFALLAMVLIAIYAFYQNKRLNTLNHEMQAMNGQLRATNRQLKDANHVKEQYICRYLEVYSDYIRRLTTMARKAGEKDSTAFMNHEMENFYRSFDDTFLSLYGTFVQDFNALLKPEARLMPKPGERMTIEMRIFALILLGIDSSAKIADLLCYSPNTISNYRVKIKNSAQGNRETFEDQVRNIRTLY